jgi:Sporulation delaying protein SdpA
MVALFTEMARTSNGFAVTATLLFTSVVMSCLAQFGAGRMSVELQNRLGTYRVLWPQKWPFFTDLDEDVLVAYRVAFDSNRLTGPGDAEFPGVGRAGDARMNEVRRLALRIPDRYWQACGEMGLDECRIQTARSVSYRVANPSGHPQLCGTFAITVERVARPGPNRLPAGPWHVHRIAVVDVRCTG